MSAERRREKGAAEKPGGVGAGFMPDGLACFFADQNGLLSDRPR